jgi:hypothetical protein
MEINHLVGRIEACMLFKRLVEARSGAKTYHFGKGINRKF